MPFGRHCFKAPAQPRPVIVHNRQQTESGRRGFLSLSEKTLLHPPHEQFLDIAETDFSDECL